MTLHVWLPNTAHAASKANRVLFVKKTHFVHKLRRKAIYEAESSKPLSWNTIFALFFCLILVYISYEECLFLYYIYGVIVFAFVSLAVMAYAGHPRVEVQC